jgi:hypothetical protein
MYFFKDLIKFASNIEGMVIFTPKNAFKPKDHEAAKRARLEGNESFKAGDFKKAFMFYSVAVIRANYPGGVVQEVGGSQRGT